MRPVEPCKFCGCTETNLVDGYYYCVECGTQDENMQETLVDCVALGDGTIAISNKRKITRKTPLNKDVELTDDWYRWHIVNFVLNGIADELIELGASPSFKIKLLWIWTKYMKVYQNKADFGLNTNEEIDSDKDSDKEDRPKENIDIASDEDERPVTNVSDINAMSMPLLIAFLYVALNLDKSNIQLHHLCRFIKDKRISIRTWQRLVPDEMKTRKLNIFFSCLSNSCRFSKLTIRHYSMLIFKKLNIGNPIVPDLRLIIDEFLQELCLPKDLKPLILSLMNYRKFDYLDVNVHYKDVNRFPSYELNVMTYILMALKLCFGLDNDYELKVSDVVDKINEQEKHPKAFTTNMYSEPTDRLFSFREWCDYIEFRQSMLWKHTLHLGAPHLFDMDEYVAMEHQYEMPDYKFILRDEIANNILNKIPNGDVNVIPKEEFFATTKPYTEYTQVIIQHLQDPEIKQLLSEDFTQYSLKYITERMSLVDPVSKKNLLIGVSESGKRITNRLVRNGECLKTYIMCQKGMVLIKDCDNHNWTITQRPKTKHVAEYETINEGSDENAGKENVNDNGYESGLEVMPNPYTNLDNNSKKKKRFATVNSIISEDKNSKDTSDSNTDKEIENQNKKLDGDAMSVDETKDISPKDNSECHIKDLKSIDIEKIDLKLIKEEEDDKNIFDDDFVGLDTKKERPEYNDDEMQCDIDESAVTLNDIQSSVNRNDAESIVESEVSSIDSINFNPLNLDREQVIKELLAHACKKYQIRVPGIHEQRQRTIIKRKYHRPYVKRGTKSGTEQVNNLIAAYQSQVESDVLQQMANMVKVAIHDMTRAEDPQTQLEVPQPEGIEEPSFTDNGEGIIADQSMADDDLHTTNPDQQRTEEDEYKLFDDSSDGETHAKELLPKKNPKFDEKMHDIRQLYMKVEKPAAIEIDIDPKVIKIVDKKIEADINDPSLLDWFQPVEEVCEQSDSDDELPLSVIAEQKRIMDQLSRQSKSNDKLNPLIKNVNVPRYNYWIRDYAGQVLTRTTIATAFTDEIDKALPKSFAFALKHCAEVVGYYPYNLLKNLHRFEKCLKDRYKNTRGHFPEDYFDKPQYRTAQNI